MKKVLDLAKSDLKELRTDVAAKLKAYMNECDESKDAVPKARDALCVYDTLWAEYDKYQTDIPVEDAKKDKKRAADAAKNNFTTKSELQASLDSTFT
jgi:hypothetical protein